ncbi:unannotated protein [freshwater metagenome]|uniref:Unannotated protein n=1 Tax=freshwater metagenome TaxID=449393 RepID=A0A6J6H3X5_9ZZZZ|nr:hypothetical protein [Actinomycetota bacterium]
MIARRTLSLSLALAIVVVALPADYQPVRASGPASIDITNRQAVLDAYALEFGRVEPEMGFTGNIATCTPGTTSSAFQLSVLQRVNWYRMMAGLPNVGYNSTHHAAAQAGTLISAAEGALTHTPSANARCYTSLGYTGTSSSNLALGLSGTKAIDAYIDDEGDNNTFVGHRRWILSRELRNVATGDSPQISTPTKTYWASNALFVFDTQNPVSARDGGVAWPPPGYVPAPSVYARWSYVLLGADFTNAQVVVTGPDGPVSTSIQSRSDFMGPGIVFTPNIVRSRVADKTYTVVISGITGAPSSTVTYSTTLVPINSAPSLASVDVNGHRCSGTALFFTAQFADRENDGFTIKWDTSARDLRYFTVMPSVSEKSLFFSAKSTLDPMRESFTFPIIITDQYGATSSSNVVANIPSPRSTTLCAPRSPVVKRTRSGTKVSWQTVPLGAKATKFVVKLSPSGKTCTTRSTSCSIAGLKKGTYNVTITASRKGSTTVSTTKRLTVK